MSEFMNKIKDLTEAAAGPALELVSEAFIEGSVGLVVPGAGNMILSYKQQRMERRIVSTLRTLIDRQEEFNKIISEIQDENALQNIKGKYFEMLMDYSMDEPQEEKIRCLVNGYFNIARIPNLQEDVIRNFYDTLKQLNLLDIRILCLYMRIRQDSVRNVMEECKIDRYQFNMIREKLARLGLLDSQKDMRRDKTQNAIVDYLSALSNGRNVKLGNARKIPKNESYRLSSYGNRFIRFIESQYDGNVDLSFEQSDIDKEIENER